MTEELRRRLGGSLNVALKFSKVFEYENVLRKSFFNKIRRGWKEHVSLSDGGHQKEVKIGEPVYYSGTARWLEAFRKVVSQETVDEIAKTGSRFLICNSFAQVYDNDNPEHKPLGFYGYITDSNELQVRDVGLQMSIADPWECIEYYAEPDFTSITKENHLEIGVS